VPFRCHAIEIRNDKICPNENLTAFDTGTGFNGIIDSFEIFEDGRVMVAGNFNQYNGMFVNGVARLNSLYAS